MERNETGNISIGLQTEPAVKPAVRAGERTDAMGIEPGAWFVKVLAAAALVASVSMAQVAAPSATATASPHVASAYLKPGILPGDARLFLKNLGTRLTAPGKEWITTTGSWTTASGTSQFSLTWQNPGLVRLDMTGAQTKSLSFDGTSLYGVSATIDQDALETLTDDVPEAFFFSFTGTAAHRFLGGRFRTDGGKTPAYAGPFYSIYQKLGGIPGSKTLSHKLYFFDAATGLLSGVQYVGSKPGTAIQFSNWQIIGGERFPGQVVRMTGSTAEFTMTCNSFTFASTGNSAIFGQH